MTVFASVVAVLLGSAVALDVLRRPVIRRLGWRNLRRRPTETVVVVVGSMLATAVIVASLMIGDSFGTSTRAWAAEQFAEIDETIELDDGATAAAVSEGLAVSLDAEPGPIDGVMALAVSPAAVTVDGRSGRDDPVIEVAAVASVPVAAPLDVPVTDRVTIASSFADEHDLVVGDELGITTATGVHRFTVEQVGHDFLGDRFELVLPLGRTDAIDGGEATSVVVVSNVGGTVDGAVRTDAAVSRIDEVLATLDLESTEVRPVKRELLDLADADADEMRSLFGTISGFSVSAGILLVVNLFVMVAAERRRELGLMRAVGLGRGVLVRSFLVEGALTGVAAAVLGAFVGIGVAAGVIGYASSALDADLLRLSVQPRSMMLGGLTGFAVSQLTVTATSLGIARLDIMSALRGLAPVRAHRRVWPRRLGAFGAIALGCLGAVFAGTDPLILLVAPSLALLGVAWLVALAPFRQVAAVAALVWPVIVFSLRPDEMNDPEVVVFLAQGLVMVGIGSWLTVLARPIWAALLNRFGGGRIGLRLGLAHPLDRSGRTGALVAMYAIVLFTVTFVAVMTAVYGNAAPAMAERVGGGREVLVSPAGSWSLSEADLEAAPGVESVVATSHGRTEVRTSQGRTEVRTDEDDVLSVHLSGVGADWSDGNAPLLADRAPVFADDTAAWKAVAGEGAAWKAVAGEGAAWKAVAGEGAVAGVAADEGGMPWVIVPDWLDAAVGETIALGPDGIEARVAGRTELEWLIDAGIHGPRDLVAETAQGHLDTRYLVAVDGDPEVVAAVLTERFEDRGVEIDTIVELAEAELGGQEVFLNMLLGYLGVGLFIGIAGLGVVLARGVVERRREIALLAAVGVEPGVVSRSFLTEALFVGGQGTILGVGLGLLSGWQILTRTASFDAGLEFVLPTWTLATIAGACLAASLVAALAPARQARRIEPAVGLRAIS